MSDWWLTAGVSRAMILISTVFGVALLGAGKASADGPVELRSRIGAIDYCLDHPDPSWFTPMVINPCNGSDSQRWNLNDVGNLESVAFPGNCLAADDSWSAKMLNCSNWPTSDWTIQPNGQVTDGWGACLAVTSDAYPGAVVSTRWCLADALYEEWDVIR